MSLKVGIILGSTRPNRIGEGVAKWVHDNVGAREEADFELVDIKDYNLPLLDEPIPPSMGKYSKEHTKRWAKKINSFDAFIFVSPEYNHSTSAALKNALDFLYQEWNNKVAGFVAYGGSGGTRSVEHLRLICAELQMATVRAQVALTLREDFENYSKCAPRSFHKQSLDTLVDQILLWGEALSQTRAPSPSPEKAQDRLSGHGEASASL